MKKAKFIIQLLIAICIIAMGIVFPVQLKFIRVLLIVGGVIYFLTVLLLSAKSSSTIMTCPTCKTKIEWKTPVMMNSKDQCLTCPKCGTILENKNIK